MINFENSEFFYEPYPHCVLNQFLNHTFYEELCKEFPEDNYMVKLESKKNDEERFNKFRLDSKADKTNFINFIKFVLSALLSNLNLLNLSSSFFLLSSFTM